MKAPARLRRFRYVVGDRYLIVGVTAMVVALMMGHLVQRLDEALIRAERAQFELRLAEIHSAILLMQASLVAKNELDTAWRYEGANPMDWLYWEPPGPVYFIKEPAGVTHYLGEMTLAEAEGKVGNWVYDPQQKVIAYLPKSLKVKTDSKSPWLQFKIVALWSNNVGEKVARGLRLQAMQNIEWLQ